MYKIALLIFRNKGHHLHFARLIFDALIPSYDITLVTNKETRDSEEFLTYFSDFSHDKILLSELPEWQTYIDLFKHADFDFIFGEDLQVYWYKIILPFIATKLLHWNNHKKLSGLICQTPYVYPENSLSNFKKSRCLLLKYCASHIFHSLFFIDEIAFKLLFPSGNKSCYVLQDPVEPPSKCSICDVRKSLNLSMDDQVISSIGLMYDTKRLDLLVDAFLSICPQNNQKLLLAGRFYTSMKGKLEQMIADSPYGKQVLLIDRWLQVNEVNDFIAISDFIAVTYDRHFANSSLLFRVCQAGKPALLSQNGWLGRYGKLHQCGYAVNIHSKQDYMAGLKLLFEGKVSNSNNLLGKHSEDKFKTDLLAFFNQ